MNNLSVGVIVLAAGKGTRMKSNLHKVLHPVGGHAMIKHLLDTVSTLSPERSTIVVGADKAQLEAALTGVDFAVQEPQLGTGHAVMAAKESFAGFAGDVLILYGDVPLIRGSTLQAMLDARRSKAAPAAVVLGFTPSDPAAYGRLVKSDEGILNRIVEFKDASADERRITLCNSGVMCVDGAKLFNFLEKLNADNAAGEYYLTDLVEIANKAGERVLVVEASETEVCGVNSRSDLAYAESIFQDRMREQAMAAGATLIDPTSVYFSHDTVVGRDVLIEPNVVFGTGVVIEDGVTVKAFSHFEGAKISSGAVVGPYARLRPGANIGVGAKIGNFVEIKKSDIEAGAKVSHLSYIGDTRVGENANIGAGTITCNYDGYNKFKTEIGAGAFIGSNTALVAPVTIGDGAIIGAGSVITNDVIGDSLAVTRAQQKVIEGWAAKFRAKKIK